MFFVGAISLTVKGDSVPIERKIGDWMHPWTEWFLILLIVVFIEESIFRLLLIGLPIYYLDPTTKVKIFIFAISCFFFVLSHLKNELSLSGWSSITMSGILLTCIYLQFGFLAVILYHFALNAVLQIPLRIGLVHLKST